LTHTRDTLSLSGALIGCHLAMPPLIPSDDPLLALALLSGRANAALPLQLLSAALRFDDADVRRRCDELVEVGLVRRTSRGFKLTRAGRERTAEEYERRMAPIDRD
jgi:RIO-like serine/threonine protein kinase